MIFALVIIFTGRLKTVKRNDVDNNIRRWQTND